MKNFIPKYQGKPTAYLDHNILDFLVKNPSSSFKEDLRQKYQVLYSDENLKEIKRTGENGSQHLNVLNDLEAMYLKLVLTPRFEFTGDAIISVTKPVDAFMSYCQNIEPVYEQLEKSTYQSLLKFYGGRHGDTFDDINNEQIDAFDNLLSYIQTLVNVDEIQKLSPEINRHISAYTLELKQSHDEALKHASQELRKHVSDEINYSGVNDYRENTGIGPVQLNNIEPPNVLEKIWEMHKYVDGYAGLNFTMEQFYGISLNPIYNREMHLFEKITSIYNVLNIVGFYPDSRMKKENRFTAAMSDAGHASIGSFADFVFSKDIAFVKKTRAAYEFLQAKTQVIEVTINNL
ncbi:hypothetical protein ACK32X_03415 [Aeromonas dhakensis]|uniref:hypothetical protein n=1 Tax=Aeromonas TaxID=642 RepID=UPI0015DC1CE3|nr:MULTISPECIES: hypothetical protein [Aeromonas]MCO4113192.1 hypothetical protein [Aeromonas hydrophila]BBS16766.1 hypothetical protein WP5W18E02_18030 [Aeromonas caviae]